MKEQYYKLSVTGSDNSVLKELVFDFGIDAIEEIPNGFIVRDSQNLDLVRFGIEEFAKKCNLKISTTLEIKDNANWIKKYQDAIKPITCGKFYIHPSWYEDDKNLINIIIDPALAFGSGHHESTASCLKLISKYMQNLQNKTALDVGCGSGILSIALSKLNLQVSACDSDIQAIDSTRKNLSKNCINLQKLFLGSIDKTSDNYDVICANIIADVIFMLAKDLKAKLNKNGYLLISGILHRYKDRILKEFSTLELIENLSKNDWESFLYQKK